MKILIFGKTGQVAQELARQAGTQRKLIQLGREQADLSDPAACAGVITDTDCDVIINAAAFTAVDLAEDQEALATTINGEAPTAMARAAAAKGVPFLHISTDYVFDGAGILPFRPDALTAPLGAYGRSKRAGEIGVQKAGGSHVILRTSWVFSAHGSNFVKTMLRLGASRDVLSIVQDQIGGPTAASDIAETLLIMAGALIDDPGKTGTYHFAGSPDTSWDCFARETFAQAGMAVAVTGIPSSEYPTPAQRPLNSRLDCSSTETVFGISRPDWRHSLSRVLDALKEQTP